MVYKMEAFSNIVDFNKWASYRNYITIVSVNVTSITIVVTYYET